MPCWPWRGVDGGRSAPRARACALCTPGQILTTKDVIDSIPIDSKLEFRELGAINLKGKREALPFFELTWDILSESNTELWSTSFSYRKQASVFQVRFKFGSQELLCKNNDPPITIGRAELNDIVVSNQSTSRVHAALHFSDGKVSLSDRSTNGTYVLPLDGPPAYAHRDQVTLMGQGEIHLGRKLEEDVDKRIQFSVEGT